MLVLITGATGFLGAHLVQRLSASGRRVRALVRAASIQAAPNGPGIETATGDVNDLASLESACQGAAAVIHAAGLVAYSRAARRDLERVNVDGTANVLTACERAGVGRLVFVSSVAAVGASHTPGASLTEEASYTLGRYNLGYFETKRKAERMVLDAGRQDRIHASAVNPSSIYGAGDARKGSRSVHVKVARGVFRFSPPGGVNVIALEDVVEGVCRALERARNGERYILAGENLRIRDLHRLIAAEAGVAPPGIHLSAPVARLLGRGCGVLERLGLRGPFDSEAALASTLFHWFDASKARRELGLEPRPAREAIAASVGWMRDNGVLD